LLLSHQQNRQAGFTLLEVLVALAIAAVGLVAISRGLGNSIGVASALQSRMVAGWIAENQFAGLRIDRAWPERGERRSRETMANRTWYILRRVTDTMDPLLRRVDVEVYEDAAYQKKLVTLFGYLMQPQGKVPVFSSPT